MIDIVGMLPRQLFELHAKIEAELLRQEITRTANNPIGDLAEHIFCIAFPDWKQERNSKAHFDAICPDGLRYQIKGRRITERNGSERNGSRQLSAIRNFEKVPFDFLAGVLFKEDYSVKRAALIPHAVLLRLIKEGSHISFQGHTNSHIFMLVDEFWNEKWKAEGVDDVTAKLQSVWY